MRFNKYKILIGVLFYLILLKVQAQDCDLSYSNQVKRIAINDSAKVAYQENGNAKTTILMIHGLGGNSTHWQQNMKDLSKNFRCIALDLPGYGLSTMRVYQSADMLDFYSSIILQFINKLKLKKVILVGHSMGGQIAIITSLKNVRAIKKLILIAPAGLETFNEAESKMLVQYSTPDFFKKQPEVAVRAGFQKNFFLMPKTAESLITDRLIMAKCAAFDPYFQMVAEGVKGMLKHPVRNQLKDIKIPTLVLYGENDELIPNKFLHKTLTTQQVNDNAKDINNVQIQGVSQAGHLVMFEQSEKCNQLITHFIK